MLVFHDRLGWFHIFYSLICKLSARPVIWSDCYCDFIYDCEWLAFVIVQAATLWISLSHCHAQSTYDANALPAHRVHIIPFDTWILSLQLPLEIYSSFSNFPSSLWCGRCAKTAHNYITFCQHHNFLWKWYLFKAIMCNPVAYRIIQADANQCNNMHTEHLPLCTIIVLLMV